MLEATAPLRADLAGGTLDLWPLYCLHQHALTVNVALAARVRLVVEPGATRRGTIRLLTPVGAPLTLRARDVGRDLFATVAFHLLPEGGIVVRVLEQPPAGSGLGGSSVLAVALAKACLAATGRRIGDAALVALLRDLEAMVLNAPTGCQDYWPALLGGPLAIHLEPGGERVERLAVDMSWLAARLLVIYSGVTHHSGMVNWQVYRARVDGDREVAAKLDTIAVAAAACRDALLRRDERAVGRAIAAEWTARRALAPAVTSSTLDAMIAAGSSAGALAGKACGAGGGGSLLLWTPPARRERVLAAVLAAAPPGAAEIGGGLRRRGVRLRHLADPSN